MTVQILARDLTLLEISELVSTEGESIGFLCLRPMGQSSNRVFWMESGKGYCPTFKVKAFMCGIHMASELLTFFSSIHKFIMFSCDDTYKRYILSEKHEELQTRI